MSTNASAYTNITFKPCDNETCLDIGRAVGIPLDDDTLYFDRIYNYTMLKDTLMLGRPRYDRVIHDDSTGTFVLVDNDGMLPTHLVLTLCKPRATKVAHGSHKPIRIYINAGMRHAYILMCGPAVYSTKYRYTH